MRRIIVAVSIVFCSLSMAALSAQPVVAAGKCTSISAQCAVEIGGRCDPATGRWEYGNRGNRGSGGTNRGGAFDGCIARKLQKRK